MRALLAAVAASILLSVPACNDDGRELEPAPDVPVSRETTTTTTSSVPPSIGSG